MTEKQVQKKITDWLKQQGVWYMKIHGSQYQMAGVPDLLIVYRGVAIFLEVKAPGKKPSAIQNAVMRQLDAFAEAFVSWYDDAQQAIDWLSQCFVRIRATECAQ